MIKSDLPVIITSSAFTDAAFTLTKTSFGRERGGTSTVLINFKDSNPLYPQICQADMVFGKSVNSFGFTNELSLRIDDFKNIMSSPKWYE
jgi:hypothetical protein